MSEDTHLENLCDACGDECFDMDVAQDDDVDQFCQQCLMEMEDEQL